MRESTCKITSSLLLTKTLRSSHFYYPHLTDHATEALEVPALKGFLNPERARPALAVFSSQLKTLSLSRRDMGKHC